MDDKLDYLHMAKVFRKKAKVFREYTERWEGVIDMGEGLIEVEPTCGTVACVGGWLAHHYRTVEDTGYRHFLDGINTFAKDLGFEHGGALRSWASDHPELWGNTRGYDMFNTSDAYGLSEDDYITLHDIAHHWDKVADKLKEIA